MDLTKKEIRDILKLDSEDLATLAGEIVDELASRVEDSAEEASTKEEATSEPE